MEDLINFTASATDDLLTLSKMKEQCTTSVAKDVGETMQKLELVLIRILKGGDKKVPSPGLIQLLENPSIPASGLVQMRRKFTTTFRELTSLIVEHCRLSPNRTTLQFKLPDLNFKLSKTTCKDTPGELTDWLNHNEDHWQDKHILCLGDSVGRHVDLPEGFILKDGFQVVRNLQKGKFYGIARPRKQDGSGTGMDAANFAERVASLVKHGKHVLEAILRAVTALVIYLLKLAHQRANIPGLASRLQKYWLHLVVFVIVVVVHNQPHLLTLVPDALLKRVVYVMARAVAIVRGTVVVSKEESAMAAHLLAGVSEELQLYLPAPPALKMLAGPPKKLMIAPPVAQVIESALLPSPSGEGSFPSIGAVLAGAAWISTRGAVRVAVNDAAIRLMETTLTLLGMSVAVFSRQLSSK